MKKRRRKDLRRHYPIYSHGLDEETIAELNRQSNINLLRSLNGNISNANGQQRRLLKREGIIRISGSNRAGNLRLEFTERGMKLLEELK